MKSCVSINFQTLPSAYEKHVSTRSGNPTTWLALKSDSILMNRKFLESAFVKYKTMTLKQ
jgi:hypothetical protein